MEKERGRFEPLPLALNVCFYEQEVSDYGTPIRGYCEDTICMQHLPRRGFSRHSRANSLFADIFSMGFEDVRNLEVKDNGKLGMDRYQ